MFLKIKRFFEKIDQEIETTKSKVLVNELYNQDILSQIQLFKMFKDEVFLPITRWSMPPREVLNICNDILLNKRVSIVEFGTGYSTIFICKLIQLSNTQVEFYSVDDGLHWQLQIKEKLKELELDQFVVFVHAPITEVSKEIAHEKQKMWYDTSVLDSKLKLNKPIDLIIVDAPYGGITPFARYSAVPYLKDRMAEKFSIFCDNTNRKEENESIKTWKSIVGGDVTDYTTYCHLTNSKDFVVAPYGVKPKGWK